MKHSRRHLGFIACSSGLAFVQPAWAVDEIQVYREPDRRYRLRQLWRGGLCARSTCCTQLDADLFDGLEYYADFGKIGSFSPLAEQQHTLFAVTDFKLGVFDVDLGVGYGLTSSSDRFVVKTIVGYAFPVPGGKPGASERATVAAPVNPMSRSAARTAVY